jgi:hypothetical protein
MVVECDSSGGDLAARFQLSAKSGWTTFSASARRAESSISIEPHLQQLPGGLDVLIGNVGTDGGEAVKSIAALLASAESSPGGQWDVLIDLGRITSGDGRSVTCLGQSNAIVIGLKSDAASAMHVRENVPRLFARFADRVGLAVIRGGGYSVAEIETFTGIPVIGEVPFDPMAAAVATGDKLGKRRLRRSLLVPSAARLATRLAQPPIAEDGGRIAGGLADQASRVAERRQSNDVLVGVVPPPLMGVPAPGDRSERVLR